MELIKWVLANPETATLIITNIGALFMNPPGKKGKKNGKT